VSYKLIQWTYCAHACFYIELILKKKKIPACYKKTGIINYTVDLHPYLNRPIPPHLSLTLPVSHLNSSKSVLQYNRNTIIHCTYFLMQVQYLKPVNTNWDQDNISM